MPKRKHPADRPSLDPDDVLAGRVKVGAAELLDLIHRVNPTGRDLRARDTELRYARKSRLQSLLVRRFGPELDILPHPEHEGTVSLLHRGHGRDGCHAVLDALDEDARAWIRLQLDVGPPSSAEPPPRVPPAERSSRRRLPPPEEEEGPPSEGTSTDALLQQAEDAVASYDFVRARLKLERAVAATGGAPEPAAALLALLVDTLGDDEGALAVQGSLSRAALARPDVRGLLALAEARAGDPEQAIAWIRGANDERAAEALAALATRALGAGDVEEAAGHLGELRRRAPAHPSVVSLGDEVARRRALARTPAEAELAGLVAAGREGEAERMAAEVLAQWPESEAARRVIRAAEERRRRVEVDRLAAEADAALAAGSAEEAKARVAQALSAARGPEREALERRMRAIEAEERAARDARAVTRVVRLLGAADLREGLGAYLGLDEALHARVREVAEGHVALLVRAVDLTGRGAPQARIEAVVALSRALERLAAGDAEAALAAIDPHHAALERVPEARQLAREARQTLASERIFSARGALAAAKVALAAGAPVEALRLLDEAVLRDLPEAERAGAAALRAEAAAGAARAERVARLGELCAGNKLFDARRVAEDLAASAADEGERARWEAERRRIQAAIQRELCVEVDEEPARGEPSGTVNSLLSRWGAQPWLAPDGRSMLAAESHGPWVQVRVHDIVDRTVRARVMLRAPERARQISVVVTGDTVWLFSIDGLLLGLSRSTWEVKVHRASGEVLAPGTWAASFALPAGDGGAAARFLWVEPVQHGKDKPVRVVDLAQRRPARELPEVERLSALLGAREPRVAAFRDGMLHVHEDRGAAVPGATIDPPGTTPMCATMHPDGRSVVVLVLTQAEPDGPLGYGWQVGLEGGTLGAIHPIEDSDGESPARLAASADAGVVAVQFRNRRDESELLVLGPSAGTAEEPSGDTLAQRYRMPVPRHLYLVQDACARKLFAVETPLERMATAEIGTTPPDLPLWSFPPQAWIEHVLDVDTCLAYAPEGQREINAFAQRLRGSARSVVATVIRQHQARAATVEEGLSLITSLELAGHAFREEAQRMITWIWEKHPNDPDVRLRRANRLARAGRWAEVEVLFDPAIDDGGPRAIHFYHLLALAALHAGDPERARARLVEGIALSPGDARCVHFMPLVELLSPPPDPPSPAELPTLAQLAEDVRAADRCLAGGDAAGALAALAASRYATDGEVQIYARMAEAHLAIAAVGTRERFRKITALARFVDAHEPLDPEHRREMPFPGGTWDRARLDALCVRARGWLDGAGRAEPPRA